MEELKNKVFQSVQKEYKNIDILCKKIQDSYDKNKNIKLTHEDIVPLLNILDTFDGMNLYE